MRSTFRAGLLALLAARAAVVLASEDPPPPLTAPAEGAPIINPPAPARPTPPANPRPTANLLKPRAPAAPPRPVAPKFVTPVASVELPPPLEGPSEMRLTDRPASRGPGPIASTPRELGPPSLILEPGPSGDDLPGGFNGEGSPDSSRKTNLDKIRPELPSRPKARRFNLFPFGAARNRDTPAGDAIRVEPRTDPAADAALKRRLETKVREAIGDRAHDIEVRVVDRNVYVTAKADRFWNRRNLRKAVENLPALAPYKTRVDIGD